MSVDEREGYAPQGVDHDIVSLRSSDASATQPQDPMPKGSRARVVDGEVHDDIGEFELGHQSQ